MTSLERGDFNAEGKWNWSAQAAHRGARYRFVQGLARARRAAHLSPAQIVEQIEASSFAGMFGELAQWATLTGWDQWPFAHTRTSADEAVKRGGQGSPEKSHWERGAFETGDDPRPFVPAAFNLEELGL